MPENHPKREVHPSSGIHFPHLDIRIRTYPRFEITLNPTLAAARIDLKLDHLPYKIDSRVQTSGFDLGLGRFYRSPNSPYFLIASNPGTERRRILVFDPKHLEIRPDPQNLPIHFGEGLIIIAGSLNLWVCKRPEKPDSLPDIIPLKEGKILAANAPDRARVIASWVYKFLNLEHP